ncbi:MAG: transporter substrate-binding protein [Solirubrobacterales bacterium]|nr:transporter substrate-binding protein [Solirubrobacterales bacterium]
MRGRAVATACLTAALAIGMVACGGNNGSGDPSQPDGANATTLTIYSSLPLRGASSGQSESIVNSEKLALEDAGGRVGKFIVKYVSLDDSAGPAGWEPKSVSEAARKAAQDKTTIGYLGDLDSGASAISIPVLNEAGILQISPSNTAVGLTESEGADKGEPEKYYPSGKRTFGRVIPADNVQAAAQITYQHDEGCTSTFLLHDNEFYGKGIVDQVAAKAPARGLQIAGTEPIDPQAVDQRSVIEKVVASGADCVLFGGRTQSNAVQLFTELHAALPTAKLFGADGLAETAFTSKLDAAVAKQVYITTPTLDPRLYPPSGQDFFRTYKARFGEDPEPLAIYGYEAMKVMLLAIQNAGDHANDKQAVVDAFFGIKDRDSVLGTYSIDENGDTTLAEYGAATVKNGKLAFQKVIDTNSTK